LWEKNEINSVSLLLESSAKDLFQTFLFQVLATIFHSIRETIRTNIKPSTTYCSRALWGFFNLSETSKNGTYDVIQIRIKLKFLLIWILFFLEN
jgi:hypothetical protein